MAKLVDKPVLYPCFTRCLPDYGIPESILTHLQEYPTRKERHCAAHVPWGFHGSNLIIVRPYKFGAKLLARVQLPHSDFASPSGMSSQPQESFSTSVFWNVESNSYNQDMVAYSGDVHPWLGTPVERFPRGANRVSLADEALAMSPVNYSERPLDVHSTILMHPFVIRPSIEAVTESAPELPVRSLPMVSAPGDFVLSESWSELHSGVRSEMAPSSWTVSPQELPEIPAVEGDSCGTPPLPPCLGMGLPVAAMGAKPDTYDPRFYSGNFLHRPVHKGRERGSSAHQIGERATHGRRSRPTCPVAGCGKSFFGQSEKNRHISSRHRPPTIGCRKCNYKQSRRDLFREHCKKHHAGESLEDLIVRLVSPST